MTCETMALATGEGRSWKEAACEADVLLWDDGNTDASFVVPDLEIVFLDLHRAGHEQTYFPVEVNLLRADVLVLTKMARRVQNRFTRISGSSIRRHRSSKR